MRGLGAINRPKPNTYRDTDYTLKYYNIFTQSIPNTLILDVGCVIACASGFDVAAQAARPNPFNR